MKISIIGTGYVGLVTGVCLSDFNTVYCIDNDKAKINMLNKGIIPIYEPGLNHIMQKNVKNKRLFFTSDLSSTIQKTDILIIAVGTPQNEKGAADLSNVFKVIKIIAESINNYKLIVIKSTVPVGTCKKIESIIRKSADKNAQFDVISNPEFLREGKAIKDFKNPDRIIVGINNMGQSSKAKKIMEIIYKPFLKAKNNIYFMDTNSSELTKYASNAMLALRISFINELANLCSLTDANIDDVRIGVGSDKRIGKLFLYPGIGYGGSCFPKDVKALYQTSIEKNYDFKLLKALDNANSHQKQILIEYILKHFNSNIKNKTFTLWGLSFKPETDDIREAPSLAIISKLLSHGAKIKAYDPIAIDNAKRIFPQIDYFNNMYDALKNSDGLIIATEWNNFKAPNFNTIKTLLNHKVIFDGRNIYDFKKMKNLGFDYYSIGRKPIIINK